jgi:hypothetical protein
MFEDACACIGIIYAYYTSFMECEMTLSFIIIAFYRAFIYGIEFAMIGFVLGAASSYMKTFFLNKTKLIRGLIFKK